MTENSAKIPYIRSSALIGLRELAGGDDAVLHMLLRAVGLPEGALEDPDGVIPFSKFSRLLELAAVELDRPSIGIDWVGVTAPDFANLGPLVFLRRFSDTLLDWLTMGLKYWHYHSNACDWRMMEDDDPSYFKLRLVFYPYAQSTRQVAETAMANLCVLGREGANEPAGTARVVRFQHRRPVSTEAHEALFRCPIEFDSRYDEIVIERKYLDYKIVGDLTWFRSLLEAYMNVRMARSMRANQSVENSVALTIASIIGSSNCTIEETARLLGMGTKKLQRLLADERTSFSQILDKSRERMARRLMLETEMSVASVAGLLDYSSPGAFILAFRRWTDETPLSYRKLTRAQQAQDGGAAYFSDL